MVNLLLEIFMKKNCKKLVKKKSGWEKCLNGKVKNYTLNGKDMTIHLIVALIKNTSPLSILSMIQYFPKPFRSF